MSKLSEMIYRDQLDPAQYTRPQDPEYSPTARRLSNKREVWRSRLSEDEQREWMEMEDLQTSVVSMELESTFCCGFRLGAALMLELLAD